MRFCDLYPATMPDADLPLLHPVDLAAWHDWLAEHHATSGGVWVVFWRKESGREPLDYDEVVREALCWGWVDGTIKVLDADRRVLWFTRRGRTSAWAASNKARVAELIAQGRMQPAGHAVIEDAKARGLWTVLDDAEALIESPDLAAALDADPIARAHWDAFPPSARKFALIVAALVAIARLSRRRGARDG